MEKSAPFCLSLGPVKNVVKLKVLYFSFCFLTFLGPVRGGGDMFVINRIEWEIQWVNPNNRNLIRSDGTLTVGMTDWNNRCVYLSKNLKGAFLRRVMAHELCHCFCFSYDLYMPIEEEERLADWISLYGTDLVYLLDDLMNMELRKAYIA